MILFKTLCLLITLILSLVNVNGKYVDYDGLKDDEIYSELGNYEAPSAPYRKGGSCILDLNKDLPKKNEPLFLERNQGSGHLSLLLPETEGKRGVIALRQGQEILLACPGNRNGLSATNDVLSRAVCMSDTSLSVNGGDLKSADLDCRTRVQAHTKITDKPCAKGKGVIIELGFESKEWVKLMEVCHNIQGSETYYAHHTIYGAALAGKVIRPKGTRPGFARGDRQLFAGFNPDAAYSQKNQEEVLTKLLGSTRAKEVLGSGFLSRGHLAPDADFLFSPHQFLTYFYVNVGPQWQAINAGNWLRVEENTRQKATSLGDDLEVVTGTYGVLSLANNKGVSQNIRLHDSRLPVPELFWKVLRSGRDDSCIAFVATNDPFASGPPAERICRDVCSANGWPLYQNDPKKGFIYCCEYAELKKAVPEMPDLACKKTLKFR